MMTMLGCPQFCDQLHENKTSVFWFNTSTGIQMDYIPPALQMNEFSIGT